MTDSSQGSATAVASPSCMRPKVSAMPSLEVARVPAPRAGSPRVGGAGSRAATGRHAAAPPGQNRSGVREALNVALAGARLSAGDVKFLNRLVHWDKRQAASILSLLRRARLAGRDEAALTSRQRELVLAALADAAVYRTGGGAASGCWDCEMVPAERCSEHARDNDRARAYRELAAAIGADSQRVGSVGPVLPVGAVGAVGAVGPAGPELARPRMLDYRRRSSVAS
jgi:hypothetical protein